MSLKNKIIEYFYPFTDKPEDFVLINKETWYSFKYRNILYSGNGGRSFRKLLHAESPLFTHGDTILEYNWSFDEETFSCEITSFDYYRNKFKSLKDIEAYEEREYQRYLEGKQDVLLQRKRYLENLNKNIQ